MAAFLINNKRLRTHTQTVNKVLLATVTTATLIATLLPSPVASASSRIEDRVDSTNITESAPLNLLNRTFARLETGLDDSVDSQRLTYRIRSADPDKSVDSILKGLLNNISGSDDESVVNEFIRLDTSAEENIDKTISTFIQTASFDEEDDEISPRLQQNFASAVKSSLARPDIQLFSAQIKEHTQSSRVLIVYDQETKDVVVLYLSDVSVVSADLTPELL